MAPPFDGWGPTMNIIWSFPTLSDYFVVQPTGIHETVMSPELLSMLWLYQTMQEGLIEDVELL